MIPGTKPAKKNPTPLSASQQSETATARQTAAENHGKELVEVLDRRAAIAATIPAIGNTLIKFLRASNNLRHTIEDEWKKSR